LHTHWVTVPTTTTTEATTSIAMELFMVTPCDDKIGSKAVVKIGQ
jgi:hypothetical protein